MKNLRKEEFLKLTKSQRSFILYIRSEMKRDRIREIFDTDIVIREIEKLIGDRVDVFCVNVDEDSELFFLREYRLPSIVVFKDGKEMSRLEGIRAWNEYLEAISCL